MLYVGTNTYTSLGTCQSRQRRTVAVRSAGGGVQRRSPYTREGSTYSDSRGQFGRSASHPRSIATRVALGGWRPGHARRRTAQAGPPGRPGRDAVRRAGLGLGALARLARRRGRSVNSPANATGSPATPPTRERARSARLCGRPHPAALGETGRFRPLGTMPPARRGQGVGRTGLELWGSAKSKYFATASPHRLERYSPSVLNEVVQIASHASR